MAKLDFASLKDEYTSFWKSMVVSTGASQVKALNDAVNTIKKNLDVYKKVTQRIRVPALVVGTIHIMEGNGDLTLHLHNGDPLTARTVKKPSGRPPTGSPPSTS